MVINRLFGDAPITNVVEVAVVDNKVWYKRKGDKTFSEERTFPLNHLNNITE